nr:hypothetical protein GCM10025732_17530 [Glycomyces mayteni]
MDGLLDLRELVDEVGAAHAVDGGREVGEEREGGEAQGDREREALGDVDGALLGGGLLAAVDAVHVGAAGVDGDAFGVDVLLHVVPDEPHDADGDLHGVAESGERFEDGVAGRVGVGVAQVLEFLGGVEQAQELLGVADGVGVVAPAPVPLLAPGAVVGGPPAVGHLGLPDVEELLPRLHLHRGSPPCALGRNGQLHYVTPKRRNRTRRTRSVGYPTDRFS